MYNYRLLPVFNFITVRHGYYDFVINTLRYLNFILIPQKTTKRKRKRLEKDVPSIKKDES